MDIYDVKQLSKRNLYETTNNILLKLYQLCNISYVSPASFTEHLTQCVDVIPNLVLDILQQDKKKIELWEKTLSEIPRDVESYILKTLEEIDDILNECQSPTGITLTKNMIEKGLQYIIRRMWKGFFYLHGRVNEKIICEDKKCKECMMLISAGLIFEDFIWKEGKEQLFKELVRLEINKNYIMQLNQYLEEVIAYIKELREQWRVSSQFVIEIENMDKHDFGKRVHQRLYNKYNKFLQENKNEKEWLLLPKTQTLFSSLGIMNEDSVQFEKCLKEITVNIDTSHIIKSLNDRKRLYEEICADLGMCKTFGFDAFGYFIYSIHLNMKERELPLFLAQNMTADRMYYVIKILIETESNKNNDGLKEFEDKINAYYNELKIYIQDHNTEISIPQKEILRITQIEFTDFLKNIRELITQKRIFENAQSKRAVLMHLKMLEWMWMIYKQMYLRGERKDSDAFIKHLNEVYNNPNMEMVFSEIKEDSVIKHIGEYFNTFSETIVELRKGGDDKQTQITNSG